MSGAGATEAGAKGAPRKRKRRSRAPSRRWIALGAVAALAAVMAFVVFRPSSSEDLDELLRQRGFLPNPGFDATFLPGAVIQVAESDGRGGERPLPRPVLALRREQCFPDLEPTEAALALPQQAGRRAGSLSLSGKRLARFLPGLEIGGEGARSYDLTIVRPRVATFAKAELSERFSRECVAWFERALDAGEKAAWYATVTEAVVADGLDLAIEWEADAGAQAKLRLTDSARKGLRATGEPVATELATAGKTVLRSTGPVVLGYQTRPMEPILDEP